MNCETANCAKTRGEINESENFSELGCGNVRHRLSGLPISYAAAEFEWGDTAALKEHLESHVKYPATGKVIKESCKVEMPDEFAKQRRRGK